MTNLATPQPRTFGLFTREEALAAGYDDRAIKQKLRRREWTRVRSGCYIPSSTWDGFTGRQQHQARTRAALIKARSDAAVSHASALAEYGVPMWDLPMDLVHLTRFDRKAGRRDTDVVQHRGVLSVDDLTRRNGVLITSPTRTALDITTMTDVEHSVVIIDGLLHAQETTWTQLCARYELMTHWPNTLSTALVLRLVDERSESVGESRTRFFCWRQGLPAPVPQYEVRVRGTLVARLDLAWPEQRVWLEFDGMGKYSDYLVDGESERDVVLREKRREDRVRELTGWICIRVTWADLAEPAKLAARIRAAFAAQQAA